MKIIIEGAKELTRVQQRSINGGSGGSEGSEGPHAKCSADCNNGVTKSCGGISCVAKDYVGCAYKVNPTAATQWNYC